VNNLAAEPVRACVVLANNLVKGLDLSLYHGPAVPPREHLLDRAGLDAVEDQKDLAGQCVRGAQQLLAELI